MAKIIDKLMSVMKLNDTYEDDFETETEEKKEEISSTGNIRPASRVPKVETGKYPRYSRGFDSSTQSEKTSHPLMNVVNFQANVQMEVVVIQPATYDEAQVIADHIRSQKPVIVNLEKLDYAIAQRIMDFVSGSVYTLGGNLERVTHNIFIIAPENVDIAGQFQEELKSNGFFLPWKSE